MKIEEVKSKYEGKLMSLPNVTGVGTGDKGGRQVIVVFVTQKVPVASLDPSAVVPDRLEGFETDVREIGYVSAQVEP